jgi:hypothetical protein
MMKKRPFYGDYYPVTLSLPKRASELSGPTSSDSMESLTMPPAKGLGNLEFWCHVAGSCTVTGPGAIPAELKDNKWPAGHEGKRRSTRNGTNICTGLKYETG